jgi:hypothetical protein
MIRTLDDEVVAVESKNSGGDFPPVPKGNYTVRLKEVKPWKTKHHDTLVVNVYNPSYEKMKGEDGKDLTETLRDVDIFSTTAVLEIVLPVEYKGRLLFGNITTHPNKPWVVPNFIHSLGFPKYKLSALNDLAGTFMNVYVTLRKGDPEITVDSDGIESSRDVIRNEVASYKVSDYEEPMDLDL